MYRQRHVTVASDRLDDLSGRLWVAGVAGVEERPGPSPARVELVVTSGPDTDDGAVAEALARAGVGPVGAAQPVPDDGVWLDSWRQFARPEPVGDALVLVPDWLDDPPDAGDRTVVRLDAGHAFGSGSHPTTRLAAAAVHRGVRPGDRVLDVGCGSGVLAVVAALAGAERVVALDIDPAALEATRANAARNGVADRVSVRGEPVADLDERFDVVVANMLAGTLVELASDIVARVEAEGRLLLTGVLDERLPAVLGAYRAAGCDLAELARDGDWVLLGSS